MVMETVNDPTLWHRTLASLAIGLQATEERLRDLRDSIPEIEKRRRDRTLMEALDAIDSLDKTANVKEVRAAVRAIMDEPVPEV